MSSSLRLGLMIPVEHHPSDDIGTRFEQVLELARLAEQAGFDYLDAPQHYLSATSQYLHGSGTWPTGVAPRGRANGIPARP